MEPFLCAEPFLCPEPFALRDQGKVLGCVRRGNVLAEGLGLVTGRGSRDGVLARQRRLCGRSSQRVKSVMEAALRDLQLAAFDAVDQTMLAGNAPRPPA